MKHFGPTYFKWLNRSTLAFAAIMMIPAFNSCNTGDEPKAPDTEKPQDPTPAEPKPNEPVTPTSPNRYEGLEDVTIPSGLASQVKAYTGFTLSFNKSNRTPNYVAWELLGTEVGGSVSRTDYFWQDSDLDGCPKYSDYTGSNHDRGTYVSGSRSEMERCGDERLLRDGKHVSADP